MTVPGRCRSPRASWADPARRQSRAATALGAVLLLGALLPLGACGGGPPPAKPAAQRNFAAPSTAAQIGYAAEIGGLDALVAAAKKEGKLNVIGLAEDWANYAGLMGRFEAKYGIAVDSSTPEASSREQLSAAARLKGNPGAPDVFDLSAAVAAAARSRLAPYKVTTWGDIPDSAKDPGGRFVGGYGGLMSIGYDARRVPAPATVVDLTKPAYRGKVAINGDPTRAGSALHAVLMAALGNGGSAQEVGPGVALLARLKQDGVLVSGRVTTSSIAGGRTPVVLDWDYTNVQRAAVLPSDVDWRVVVPKATVGEYSVQAINLHAPHPAAARLWQEFVLSDEGQNLFLRSRVRPARADAMRASGALEAAGAALLPSVGGPAVLPTPQQVATAKEYLDEHWTVSLG